MKKSKSNSKKEMLEPKKNSKPKNKGKMKSKKMVEGGY